MKRQRRVDRNSRGGLDGAYGKVDVYACIANPGHYHVGKSVKQTYRLRPYKRDKRHAY